MERLSNSFFLVVILAFVTMQMACSQNVNTGNQSEMVDTLGGQFERIIHDYYGDTAVKTVRYHSTDKDYLEVIYHPTGEKYMEGWVKNGERIGQWISFYPNGTVWSYGEYENGKRTGESEAYFENGNVRIKQNFYEDLPDGTWKFYRENGELQLEVEYNKGEKISEITY